MRRLRLLVEYDGTGFCGFQCQPGLRTVQGEMERVLAQLCGHPVEITAAGRTDAGVHALGQVAHLDTTGRIAPDDLARAATDLMGGEIVVRRAEDVEPKFHARFSAIGRTYEYRMSRAAPTPMTARWVVHDWGLRQDAGARMNEGLQALHGTHDFTSFCAAEETRDRVRTVQAATVEERGEELRLLISADAFLHHMVRNVAGLLLEIGRGRREPETVGSLLEARDRTLLPGTAPARGLCLLRVEYREEGQQ